MLAVLYHRQAKKQNPPLRRGVKRVLQSLISMCCALFSDISVVQVVCHGVHVRLRQRSLTADVHLEE